VAYERIVLDMSRQRARSVADLDRMAAGRRMTRGIDVYGNSFTRMYVWACGWACMSTSMSQIMH
jgi:hypothetical protein